ncbi:DUF262 domain-containing protein [Neisseria montereyensis]|uniref:DUF262 domain-containing protein n=1 Tax=Neisseria montereyensis TaxID=2973938 RepID=A0ABT2FBU7_9NEIS|nr:DUF262 domain-containing protein [Neisseria montereyensis]MCS4533683.1 DUF262 domain-containing protein [Neisseria montereyensis]
MNDQDEKLQMNNQYLDDNEYEDEYEDEDENNELMAYDIAVFYNTYNLSTLMKWWGKKLIVPKFQRSYVWNQKKASEFVDSMLRGLPVPSMFFYDDIEKNRLIVVDGLQRLTSLYRYIVEGSFSGEKKFKLIGNIHPKWKGKTYEDLEAEDKDRLDDALMNITVMRQLTPHNSQSSMYLSFQRINTGGITLKPQEIRMAVSFGDFAIYLDELATDTRFDKWKFLRTDAQRKNDNYSPIQELILKFWAYYFSYPDFSGSSSRGLLDDFFDAQKDFENPVKKESNKTYYSKADFDEAFNAAFDLVNELSEQDLSPYTKPTQTYLESIWVGLTYRRLKLKKNDDISIDKLKEHIKNWKDVIGEDKFSELFQARRASSMKSVRGRIEAGIDYFGGDF